MLTVEGSYENISKIVWFVLRLHIKLKIKIDSIFTCFLVCMSAIIFKKVLLTFRYWSLTRNTGWSKEELKFVRKGHQEKETKADKHQSPTKLCSQFADIYFLAWLCGVTVTTNSVTLGSLFIMVWFFTVVVHQGITQLNILTLQVEEMLGICAQNLFSVLPIFLTLG